MALTGAIAIAVACLLACAQSAGATTRFAAPGGTGSAPCTSPDQPCRLFEAADSRAGVVEAGDEVILAPGTYSGTDASFEGVALELPAKVKLIGEPGKPRPVISGSPASLLVKVGAGGGLFHLELRCGDGRATFVAGGTIEDVISIATGEAGSAGALESLIGLGGSIRDSVFLVDSGGGEALEVSGFGAAPPPTLRNVTAVATGAGSVGIRARYGVPAATVSAKSVIAQGGATDIKALAIGAGSSTAVDLESSDYDSVQSELVLGATSATVTAPGTNGNIVAPPLLAADGFHELPGSPTVDGGVLDASSGAADIDGQLRAIDAPDIGADELGHASSTGVVCSPTSFAKAGGSSTCVATVADSRDLAPTGTVSFEASGRGAFGAASTCTLEAGPGGRASCRAVYFPAASSGTHTITASYAGDAAHEPSRGATDVTAPPPPKPPATRLLKTPRKRASSRLARFRFSSNQPGSRFECRLDRKRFRRCRSPFARKVSLGRHVFRVRAVSAAGLADPTPAVFRWTVVPPTG